MIYNSNAMTEIKVLRKYKFMEYKPYIEKESLVAIKTTSNNSHYDSYKMTLIAKVFGGQLRMSSKLYYDIGLIFTMTTGRTS